MNNIAIHQGDILKIEKINKPVLVLSKNFFNETYEIIGCPIYNMGSIGPLHISITTDKISGIAHCEKLTLLDLNYRGFTVIDRIKIADIINITDAVQSIFDN